VPNAPEAGIIQPEEVGALRGMFLGLVASPDGVAPGNQAMAMAAAFGVGCPHCCII